MSNLSSSLVSCLFKSFNWFQCVGHYQYGSKLGSDGLRCQSQEYCKNSVTNMKRKVYINKIKCNTMMVLMSSKQYDRRYVYTTTVLFNIIRVNHLLIWFRISKSLNGFHVSS